MLVRRRVVCLTLATVFLGAAALWNPPTVTTLDSGMGRALTRIFQLRGQALVAHNVDAIKPYYDLSSKPGTYAFQHEATRTAYIKSWEGARGAELVGCDVRIRVTRIKERGTRRYVNLRQTAFFEYTHAGDPKATRNRFAVDTLHSVELEKRGGNWVICKEWYLDPLKEDTIVPDVTPEQLLEPSQVSSAPAEAETTASLPPGSYNRASAVAYAHEYCGVALTVEGRHHYNPAYRNYNGRGGDCTNFASQVLHDGGGMPMGGGWSSHHGKGSKAWVHTDSLARYLTHSGRASRLMKGDFREVMTPSTRYPLGAIQALEGGDLIAYEEKGDIVHFAVVVGRDSAGYILVDSHTADRYKVPWDLGWDKKTVFWLVKVKY